MAAAKQTPRQKMIAMMYLVMTALLALNISKDALTAFVIVDESIIASNKIIENKLQDTYKKFEFNYMLNKQKVKPQWNKAQKVRELSKEMHNYIDKLKSELIAKAEGISVDSAYNLTSKQITRKDENTMPTNYFLGGSDDGSKGMARKLKNKINNYRESLLELIDEEDLDQINIKLETNGEYSGPNNKSQNWEVHHFYNTVIVADIVILNKLKLDIFNTELEVVNYFYKSIGKGEYKFEKIEAKVVPKSNFVFIGDIYDAEIIVAAYDTSQSPDVFYSTGIDFLPVTDTASAELLKTETGKINLKLPAHSEGIKKYAGFVRTITSTGQKQNYHFSGEYVVAKPSNVISAKKMNVLYIGVDNPISISISGVPRKNLLPKISCGTIKPDSNSDDWIVNIPPDNNNAIITTFAEIDGVKKEMGSKRFRVKKLPDPIATVANKNSGYINRKIILAAGRISPKMPPDFDFEHKFTIKSFTLTIQRGFKTYHFNSNDAYLTDEMKAQLKRTNRGQNIVFENIIAVDPNNSERYLAPIVLTIN